MNLETPNRKRTRKPSRREEEARERRHAVRGLFRECTDRRETLAAIDQHAAMRARIACSRWAPQLAKTRDPMKLLWILLSRAVENGDVHPTTGRMLVELVSAVGALQRVVKSGDAGELAKGLGVFMLTCASAAFDAVGVAQEAGLTPLCWGDLEYEDLWRDLEYEDWKAKLIAAANATEAAGGTAEA